MKSGESHCNHELANDVADDVHAASLPALTSWQVMFGEKEDEEEEEEKEEEKKEEDVTTFKNLTTLTWQVGKNSRMLTQDFAGFEIRQVFGG